MTVTLVTDKRDQPVHIFVETQDITARKKMEDELAEKAAELARSNTELEQFAYIASHDLQEPLRAVSSYVSMIAKRYEDKIDEKGRMFIKHAVDGTERMQHLINDVLTYSRSGKSALDPVKVDCNAMITDILGVMSDTLNAAGVIVTTDNLPSVPYVPIMLRQVFQNLISNAVKFRSSERPTIHISASKEDDHWVFSVRDNGIGIAERHHERVFRLFERLHSRDRFPGTGLGLAICRKIVERHAGKIWISSSEGNGTTVFFSVMTRKGVKQ